MKSFLKFFLAAFAALVVFCLFFVFFISAVASAGEQRVVDVDESSVLHLTFENPIVDKHSENSIKFDLTSFSPDNKDGLNNILTQIAKAKVDPKIKGILIESRVVMTGIGTMQEIREAIVDFKQSGKWVMGYSDVYSQSAYYIASTADELYVQPEGMVELKGLQTNIAFLKEALDNLGVEMQVIRPKNNKFKSAVEPFLLDSMSGPNEEQVSRFLGTLWTHMADEMAKSRQMDVATFNGLVDKLESRTVQSAIDSKLLDGAKYRDEIESAIREKLGLESDEEISYVSLSDYTDASVSEFKNHQKEFNRDSRIAVIYATGGIDMGDGSEESIGSEGLSAQLAEARADSAVKAIVLRVNSGGGSALASDIIWRETVLCKETKPFIVSMGDVAASGGYYIACEADKVFANENTITGSIGVFGTIPNMEELYEETLGVNFDGVKTHEFADIYDVSRPLRTNEEAMWQEMVDDIYDDFTSKVAKGRGKDQKYINSIGQGRVWSGTDAKEKGLIDEFGGLQDAIDAAVEMAGVEDDYMILNFPKEKEPFEQFMEDLGMDVKESIIREYIGEDMKILEQAREIRKMTELKGVQMRMPYLITIE